MVDAASATPTSCFTRSYGRFARGTGSVLFVSDGTTLEDAGLGRSDPARRAFGGDWRAKLGGATLRFFTPKEVANLLGFPPAFFFPADVSTRAAWAAMGNSLHVDAAAAACRWCLDRLLRSS